jgi:hypothetical protein
MLDQIKADFPRTTHSLYDLDESRRFIEVYDDELPGSLVLYYSDGERRHGIRSIDLTDKRRAAEILAAWAGADEKVVLMGGSRIVRTVSRLYMGGC